MPASKRSPSTVTEETEEHAALAAISEPVSRNPGAGRATARISGSGWSRAIVRGVRANDLSGKAGEIAAELEERLVSGHYRFGETLSIYTLASQFEASRQPVAAAVLYLRSVGYLEIIPQVGCRVVSPSPQEVEDFYVLFSHTEAVISRFAAQRHEGEEAEELLAIAEELAANPFKTSYDRRAMADGISIFHDRISAMARSQLVVERISNLRRIFRFYLSQGRLRPDPVSGPPTHMNQLRIDLAQSILARKPMEAGSRTEEYILNDIDEWARVV
ncbi:GntR family transcriptional regulator [Nevskia ramosa]|uniref:GntR family transcriptional regulator n=1 Tax=Nevskia ramosa TaxID=64002 RepID=UPI0003B690CD|nr:GntR family transcriptional regulator [Nevskia ramosa]